MRSLVDRIETIEAEIARLDAEIEARHRACDGYLRRLLAVGASAVIRSSRKAGALHGWLARLLERKKPKVAAVALANKIVRIAWAVLARDTTYQAKPARPQIRPLLAEEGADAGR